MKAVYEFDEQFLVALGCGSGKDFARTLVVFDVFPWNGGFLFGGTGNRPGLTVQYVDYALESWSLAHRHGDRADFHLEMGVDLLDRTQEIRLVVVHVVDEHKSGLVPAVQHAP